MLGSTAAKVGKHRVPLEHCVDSCSVRPENCDVVDAPGELARDKGGRPDAGVDTDFLLQRVEPVLAAEEDLCVLVRLLRPSNRADRTVHDEAGSGVRVVRLVKVSDGTIDDVVVEQVCKGLRPFHDVLPRLDEHRHEELKDFDALGHVDHQEEQPLPVWVAPPYP